MVNESRDTHDMFLDKYREGKVYVKSVRVIQSCVTLPQCRVAQRYVARAQSILGVCDGVSLMHTLHDRMISLGWNF